MNISPNLVSGRCEKQLGVQKASGGGGAKMAIRGAKLTFGCGKKIGSTKAPGGAKSLIEKPKKSGDLFCFVLETVKNLYFVTRYATECNIVSLHTQNPEDSMYN